MNQRKKEYPTILQIIPAPAGMVAVYAEDDGTLFEEPIACLALVEDVAGDGVAVRYVSPVEFDPESGLDPNPEAGAKNRLGYRIPGRQGPDFSRMAKEYLDKKK